MNTYLNMPDSVKITAVPQLEQTGSPVLPYALTPCKTLYPGIQHRVGATALAFDTQPPCNRVQRVNVLKIDLSSGVNFCGTPPCLDDNGQIINAKSFGQTVTEFMNANSGVQLAVNANYCWCQDGRFPSGTDYEIFGASVTGGKITCDPAGNYWGPSAPGDSPNVPSTDYPGGVALLLSRTSVGYDAVFTYATHDNPVDLTGVEVAVAGSPQPSDGNWCPNPHVSGLPYLLLGGVNQGTPSQIPAEKVAARTGVGLDATKQNLFIITIDGLDSSGAASVSQGAGFYDLAQWFIIAGATDAINLDGGGSTVMAVFDAVTQQPVLLNTPYGDDKTPGYQRRVASYFGVIPDGYPKLY